MCYVFAGYYFSFFYVFLLFCCEEGCTWTVLDGEFDSVFVFLFLCKSKDFKAFLRCSCVHFFSVVLLFCFAIITVIVFLFFLKNPWFTKKKKEKKNLCSQRKHDVWSLEWGRHSFVNRTQPDYAEPFWGSCRLLKTPPKKLKGDRGLKKVEIGGGGGGGKI